jgi:hypothetical protein
MRPAYRECCVEQSRFHDARTASSMSASGIPTGPVRRRSLREPSPQIDARDRPDDWVDRNVHFHLGLGGAPISSRSIGRNFPVEVTTRTAVRVVK